MKLKVLVAAVAVFAAAPAAPAAAAPGWELPQVSSFVGGDKRLPNTTYARHCGSSRFGVYRFVVGVTDRGRQGAYHFKVRLSSDGTLHRPNGIRRTGYIARSLRRQTDALMRQVAYRYVGGPQPRVETVFRATGKVQAARAFDPVARRC